MIDIHCHVLPGIDDGPDDLACALAMGRAAVEAHISTVVATPHLRADFPNVKIDEISDRCAALATCFANEGINLEVVPGGEVSLSWAMEASDDALRQASYGQAGRYLLIETPLSGATGLPLLLSQVASRGYSVVLAHPERSNELQHSPETLKLLVESGIILQVNADALLGNPRRSRTAKLALALCDAGLARVVASDGHRGQEWRPVGQLAYARAALVGRSGLATADAMCCDVPAAIVAAESLPPPMSVHPRGGFPRVWRR
jgi:protein-tyrosine phosphatase